MFETVDASRGCHLFAYHASEGEPMMIKLTRQSRRSQHSNVFSHSACAIGREATRHDFPRTRGSADLGMCSCSRIFDNSTLRKAGQRDLFRVYRGLGSVRNPVHTLSFGIGCRKLSTRLRTNGGYRATVNYFLDRPSDGQMNSPR